MPQLLDIVLQQIKRVGLSFIHLVFLFRDFSLKWVCLVFNVAVLVCCSSSYLLKTVWMDNTHRHTHNKTEMCPGSKKCFNGQENFDSFFLSKNIKTEKHKRNFFFFQNGPGARPKDTRRPKGHVILLLLFPSYLLK